MKFFAVIALALLLICMVQAQQSCPDICPANLDPVCATNGNCVKTYGNQCMLEAARCSGDSDFKQVPLSNCNTGRKC